MIHVNFNVQRTVEGKDVLFLDHCKIENVGDDDKILSLEELSLLRRRILLISESPLSIVPPTPDDVFVLTPIDGVISCCSIEAVFYQFFLKQSKRQNRGNVEEIIRTQAQVFTKFIKSTCAPLLLARDSKTGSLATCPLCFHLLLTHLMSVYFYSWMHKRGFDIKKYPNTLLGSYPVSLQLPSQEVFEFLDSLVN